MPENEAKQVGSVEMDLGRFRLLLNASLGELSK
jgi:hypothetical protein